MGPASIPQPPTLSLVVLAWFASSLPGPTATSDRLLNDNERGCRLSLVRVRYARRSTSAVIFSRRCRGILPSGPGILACSVAHWKGKAQALHSHRTIRRHRETRHMPGRKLAQSVQQSEALRVRKQEDGPRPAGREFPEAVVVLLR